MLSEIYSLPKPQPRQIEFAVRQLGGIAPGLAKASLGFALALTGFLRYLPARTGEARYDFVLYVAPFLFLVGMAFVAIATALLKTWYGRRFGYVANFPKVPYTAREMKLAAFGVTSFVIAMLVTVAALQPRLSIDITGGVMALGIALSSYRSWRAAPQWALFALGLFTAALFSVPGGFASYPAQRLELFGIGLLLVSLCDHWLLLKYLPETPEESPTAETPTV
jgi:hypothetical protein